MATPFFGLLPGHAWRDDAHLAHFAAPVAEADLAALPQGGTVGDRAEQAPLCSGKTLGLSFIGGARMHCRVRAA